MSAYRVQQELDAIAFAAGERPAGYKIGLTSPSSQAAFGTDGPVRGTLSRSMVLGTEAVLDHGRFVAPRIEAEIAFVIGRPIRGAAVSQDELEEAVVAVAPALEVVDSRVDGWAATAVDIVADAGAAAAAVLGERVPLEPGMALPERCVLHHGDRTTEGTSAAVEGGPWGALGWLVRHLAAHGRGIEPGDVIMSGTWTVPSAIERGTVVRADFGALGTVRASFA